MAQDLSLHVDADPRRGDHRTDPVVHHRPWFIDRLKSRQIGETIRDDGPKTTRRRPGRRRWRLADPVLPHGLDAPVVRPAQSVRTARAERHGRVRGDRIADDYAKVAKKNKKGISGKLRLALEFAVAGARWCICFIRDHAADVRLHLQLPFTNFYTQDIVLPRESTRRSARLSSSVAPTRQPDRRPRRTRDRTIDHERRNVPDLRLHRGVETTIVAHVGQPPSRSQSISTCAYQRVRRARRVLCALFGAGVGFLWYNTYRHRCSWAMSARCPRRLDRHARGADQERARSVDRRRAVRRRGTLGDHPDSVFKATKRRGEDGKVVGKRVFAMAPIHHHYELKGWEEPKIIVRFWLVSLLLALVALGTLKLR